MRLLATQQGIGAAPPPPAAARRSWLKRLAAGLGAALLARPAAASPTRITGEVPYIGEIMLFAGTFDPQGWEYCNGQLLNISQYTTLFNLIGTTYGGDGVNTFAVPDLRGRTPRHIGQGPGLSNYALGQTGGTSAATVPSSQLPAHTHPLNSAATATSASPVGALPAPATGTDLNGEAVAVNMYAASATATSAANEVGSIGGQTIPLTPATQGVIYCIATDGIYPTPQ